MSEKKTARYFKYAIGEIILVVVGILIAIQVNNWNNDRIMKKQEDRILKELNNEFKDNKRQLQWAVAEHEEIIEYCDRLIQIIDNSSHMKHLDSIPEYIRKTFFRATYNPSMGTINSLINTEALKAISNDQLRKEIIGWEDLLSDYTEDEITQSDFVLNSYVPYMSKYFSRTRGFNHPDVDLSFLESIENESYVHRRRIYAKGIIKDGPESEIEKLFFTIDRIIEPTDNL